MTDAVNGTPRIEMVEKVIEAIRVDSLENLITGIGVAQKDARVSTGVVRRAPFQQKQIDDLYEQDDIFPLIIDGVPEDATRRWIRMTGAVNASGKPDKDFGRKAIEELERVDAQFSIFELFRQHRKDGGSAILIGVNDTQEIDKPLNLETIQSVDYLHVLTRAEFSIGDIDRNPKSPNFRQPEFYTLNGDLGTKVHHTRIVRIRNHMVSSDKSQGSAGGWDNPVIERVWEAIRQLNSLCGAVEACIQDLQQGVMTIEGLTELMSSDRGTTSVKNRVQTIALLRSMLNVILLDGKDKYERRQQAPTGVDPLLLRAMDRVCAAAEMPASRLFGQPPAGMSTDDESGRRRYYDSVANKQNRLLRRPITRILDALIAAKKGPFKGRAPKQWSFEFLPLEQPNEQETSARRLVDVQTEEKLIALQVLDPVEVRAKYANDPETPWPLSDEISEALAEANQPAEPDDGEDENELDPDLDPELDDEENDVADKTREDSFDESRHPRDDAGKFSTGGGAAPKRSIEEINANIARLKAATAAVKEQRKQLKKDFEKKLKEETKRHKEEMKATAKKHRITAKALIDERKRVEAETRKIEAGLRAEDRARDR